jgi:hypothetical protein
VWREAAVGALLPLILNAHDSPVASSPRFHIFMRQMPAFCFEDGKSCLEIPFVFNVSVQCTLDY